MLYAMISGTLATDPVSRKAANRNDYATANVRVPMQTADAQFVSVAAFDDDVSTVLLRLHKGDAVSVAGLLKPTSWTGRDGEPRNGLSLTAQRILTAKPEPRRRGGQPEQRQVDPSEEFDAAAGDLSVLDS